MKIRLVAVLLGLGLIVAGIWMSGRVRREGERTTTTANERPAEEKKLPTAEAVGAFYVGVSSLDVEANERAAREFEALSKTMTDEPAVWTNLAIARLRLGELEAAEAALNEATRLAPQEEEVALLQATIAEDRGDFAGAIARLRGLPDPDAAALHRLADLLGRTGQQADPEEQLAIFDRIRAQAPDNLVVAFNRARLLARMENKERLEEALADFEAQRANWSAAAGRQLEAARAAVAAGNFRAAGTQLTFLQNLLQPTPEYQAALASLGLAGGSVGRPQREFVNYRRLETAVSPADRALEFLVENDAGVTAKPELYVALDLGAKPEAARLALAGGRLRVGDAGELDVGRGATPAGRNAICAADLNGDFRPDLIVAAGGELGIWIQDEQGRFEALSPAEELRVVFEKPAQGAWALDYDADGDLDVVVGREGAAPDMLRNNGDGGFTAVDALAAFSEVREMAWCDLDDDGDGDLAMIAADGRVLVSWNERAGMFAAPVEISARKGAALALGDVAGTGEMSVAMLADDGAIEGATWDRRTRAWATRELGRWDDASDLATVSAKRASVHVADLDNNGAVDVVVSAGASAAVWLNEGRGEFRRLERGAELFVTSVADLDGDGLLDLVGLTGAGAATARGRSEKGYRWQTIHTRTLATRADGRINSFGIGGRIEVRAGALLAVAPITAPRTHFGLGAAEKAGLARIVWPNGVAQVEFDLEPNQEVTATQRLKGSCPWLFARDGDTLRFVKDFIWRSPLGMRINSQDTAGVEQTEDWAMVPGEFVSENDGAYEFRITAELWETHFFDRVALKVVDHPAAFDVLVDERFVPTSQPKLEVIAATAPRAFAAVVNESGRDVARELGARDRVYVDDFPLGQFQGIAEDHWLEFRLPDEAPRGRPLVLVGEGWIYPTDSSLNVAISQGRHRGPQGLMLEEYDETSGWRAVSGDLGFPAGKNKTVVLPLPRESLEKGQRRFRLRTNLEIYWDRLGWAEALPEAEVRETMASMRVAELRPRGFSKIEPERRKPDFPEYGTISGRGPRWRDLEGFYTRFGDVRELFEQTDDRYLIMNAGDEIVLRFAALPPPPDGWTRDFVLIGDGWVKDGDFNTANSRTVHPLPSHAQREYPSEPRTLEEDPVYQRHGDDWRNFHTRYVTPSAFGRGLMRGVAARAEKQSQ